MYMYVCHICARSLWSLDRDLRFSGPGVTHAYELLCGCWNQIPILCTNIGCSYALSQFFMPLDSNSKRRLILALVTDKNEHNILLPNLILQDKFVILEITLDLESILRGLQKINQVLYMFQIKDLKFFKGEAKIKRFMSDSYRNLLCL